jgi:hypothetical protein
LNDLTTFIILSSATFDGKYAAAGIADDFVDSPRRSRRDKRVIIICEFLAMNGGPRIHQTKRPTLDKINNVCIYHNLHLSSLHVSVHSMYSTTVLCCSPTVDRRRVDPNILQLIILTLLFT